MMPVLARVKGRGGNYVVRIRPVDGFDCYFPSRFAGRRQHRTSSTESCNLSLLVPDHTDWVLCRGDSYTLGVAWYFE